MHHSTEIKTGKLCHANYLLHNLMMVTDPALDRKQSFEDDHTIIPFTDFRVNETYLMIDIFSGFFPFELLE